MKTNDTIDTLNNLIETSIDGEYGFRSCGEHAHSAALKQLFVQRSDECRLAATDLQSLVSGLGGKPDTGGSVSGAAHRGWVAVKSTLSGYSDKAILEEAERGEDHALDAYRKALEQTLPADIRAIVERQYEGVKRNHVQVRTLRDDARLSSS